MATLKVPAHVPSPAEDAEQLRKAFQGSQFQCLIYFLATNFDHVHLIYSTL